MDRYDLGGDGVIRIGEMRIDGYLGQFWYQGKGLRAGEKVSKTSIKQHVIGRYMYLGIKILF
jgi:hypothetical protein